MSIGNNAVPLHAGIIMDGNGRWAKARGLPRTEGHREGLRVAKRIIREAEALGIRYLSLYTFSTENWKRTVEEVSFLMSLISSHLRSELDFYRDNHIRIVHSGDPEGLPREVREAIRSVIEDTASFDGITVNLAINYGGRDEILRAVRRMLREGRTEPDEEAFRACLDVPGIPDPDLIIRTGGDMRISNFLLWESAYAELYFSEKLWPDWSEEDLKRSVDAFSRRERRYGGTA